MVVEAVGVAEGGADDDVGAALDELLRGGLDGRGVLGHVLDELDLLADFLFDLHAGFVEGLRPAAVVLRTEVEHRDLRLVLEREAVGGRGGQRDEERAAGSEGHGKPEDGAVGGSARHEATFREERGIEEGRGEGRAATS